jgi:hypothetical protein
MEEKKSRLRTYLETLNTESKITEFKKKVDKNGFLREACISHMKNLSQLPTEEVTKILDEWLAA